MSLKNCVTIDYTDFFPCGEFRVFNSGEIKENQVDNTQDWGRVAIRSLELSHARVYEVKANLKRNLHVRHHEDRECSSINSCFSLNGEINSSFYGIKGDLYLEDGTQNFMYKPVLSDNHFVRASDSLFQIFHLEIDVSYYVRLLDINEKWSDVLREKIHKKQIVAGSADMMAITSSMYKSIHEILNCSVSGPLRHFMLEAKILELLAYQLDQFRTCSNEQKFAVSKIEKERFYELREYLDQSFNQEHSLKSLAKQFGLNEFKLKRGFKDLFGNTVFGYVQELKMREAKLLIEEFGMNVSQVASKAGYKNPNHFSAAFKRQFGLSPSMIRK